MQRKRLQKMRAKKDTASLTLDPFRKTFLERVRDKSVRTISVSREDWIRCRLRWFSEEDWRGAELVKELGRHLTTQERLKPIRMAVDYNMEPSYEEQRPRTPTAEYESLLRKGAIPPDQSDFSPDYSLDSETYSHEEAAMSADFVGKTQALDAPEHFTNCVNNMSKFQTAECIEEKKLLPISIRVESGYFHST